MSQSVSKLIDLLESAKADDLVEVDKRIAAKEQEIETLVAGKRKELETLQLTRKLLDTRVNGKKPRAKPGTKKPRQPREVPGTGAGPADKGESTYEKRVKIAKYIDKYGSQQLPEIAANTGLSAQGLHFVMQCSYFKSSTQGYHLTPEGRQALL
jgi:hypothetical protein